MYMETPDATTLAKLAMRDALVKQNRTKQKQTKSGQEC